MPVELLLPRGSVLGWQPTEPFRPARGIVSGHAQTIFAHFARSARAPACTRERWDTPDGDFIDVDILAAPPGAPRVLILHGLEGSSRSGYVASVLRLCRARGWGAVALNLRSCSGEPNRLPAAYHAGDTRDVTFALAELQRRGEGPLLAVGFSLGASMLLTHLGDTRERSPLVAAAVVSAPFDLAAGVSAVDTGRGPTALYRRRFLRRLRKKGLAKARTHPGLLDRRRVRKARSLLEFDEAVTARLFDFTGAADYYARCSAIAALPNVRRPTLLLSAADDPLVPGRTVPVTVARANPYLELLLTDHGGHVGFVGGTMLRPRYWAEQQVVSFFAHALAASVGAAALLDVAAAAPG